MQTFLHLTSLHYNIQPMKQSMCIRYSYLAHYFQYTACSFSDCTKHMGMEQTAWQCSHCSLPVFVCPMHCNSSIGQDYKITLKRCPVSGVRFPISATCYGKKVMGGLGFELTSASTALAVYRVN